MKTSLIIFGILFLVFGVVFYLNPVQSASATTTTDPVSGEPDVRTSSASIQIPSAITYAMLTIGAILLILGFVLGTPARRVDHDRSSTVVHTKEEIGKGGRRRTVHEKTIRRER